MTTVREYIAKHPRSYLAGALVSSKWELDRKIEIVGGLPAPNNKNSNLYKALEQSKYHEWIIGGHRKNGPDGFWMAVS